MALFLLVSQGTACTSYVLFSSMIEEIKRVYMSTGLKRWSLGESNFFNEKEYL